MKIKNFSLRKRGALAGFTLSILLILVAIALPSDGSFSGNIGKFACDLLVAPADWLIQICARGGGTWRILAVMMLGPTVFWTVYGGIIGITLEIQSPRKQQILFGAALYLGVMYYDYFVANPPKPGGMIW